MTICSHSSGFGYFGRYHAALRRFRQAISNQKGIAANDLDLFIVEIDGIAFFNHTTDERDIGVFIQFERYFVFVTPASTPLGRPYRRISPQRFPLAPLSAPPNPNEKSYWLAIQSRPSNRQGLSDRRCERWVAVKEDNRKPFTCEAKTSPIV